jgi:hypothetical protein
MGVVEIISKYVLKAVLRIWVRMFLGHQDPSIFLKAKIVRKTLILSVF